MDKMSSDEKKMNVPLEEALNIAGTGRYTTYVIIASGCVMFSVILNIQSISTILPVAGCDLDLSNGEKGTLNSIIFAGMLITGPIAGFLSDAYGRKRISVLSEVMSTVLVVLSSFAPDPTTLMALGFVNGIALTGAITPAYVLVSEFCPQAFRPKAVIMCCSIAILANIYLPGMALLIMPLDIDIPILGILNFSQWRLFLLITTIPNLVALLLIWKVPETPKFLLNQGLSEDTLEILKNIYAVNQKKKKEEFPVSNVVLDFSDAGYEESGQKSSTLLGSIKQMTTRTRLLFSKGYILNTIVSCIMIFTLVGVYNVYVLWLPEKLSRIKNYSYSNDEFDTTLCDLMSSHRSYMENEVNCKLNYNFFSYSIMLGILQVPIGILASLYAVRIGLKLMLVSILLLAAGLSTTIVYLDMEYLIIAALVSIIVLMGVAFPMGLTFILEYYPTYARSTASAVTMIFGRFGAASGGQLMGLLFDNYCQEAYWGIALINITTAILCLLLPSKKKY